MLGIKDAKGNWFQVSATIAHHVDTFGPLLGAFTCGTQKHAKNLKTRLEGVGFSGLEICECDPLSGIQHDTSRYAVRKVKP